MFLIISVGAVKVGLERDRWIACKIVTVCYYESKLIKTILHRILYNLFLVVQSVFIANLFSIIKD